MKFTVYLTLAPPIGREVTVMYLKQTIEVTIGLERTHQRKNNTKVDSTKLEKSRLFKLQSYRERTISETVPKTGLAKYSP